MSLLCVHDLGKCYRSYWSEWQRFANWLGCRFRARDEHWVLRHVNFDIQPGEAVAIVGQNGAGKSTLLKLICGTLQPVEGQVNVHGRIAAILELGMGFDPELTGRQNVSHAAGLMGFSSDWIEQALPEIERFAEIGEYFDQPIRTCSSGMQMRIAFAVATAHRPDILIVDEALSVGDAYFQHKCFDRIRSFQEQGTSLLIVSHDPGAILALCDRAILLEQGRMIKDGTPEEVMDYYNALVAEHEGRTVRQSATDEGRIQTISGTGEVTIRSLELLNEAQQAVEYVSVGQLVRLRICLFARVNVADVVVGFMVKDRLGQTVYGTNSHLLNLQHTDVQSGDELTVQFQFPVNLGEGTYAISVAAHAGETHLGRNYEWRDLALVFRVVNLDKPRFVGVAWLPTDMETLT